MQLTANNTSKMLPAVVKSLPLRGYLLLLKIKSLGFVVASSHALFMMPLFKKLPHGHSVYQALEDSSSC